MNGFASAPALLSAPTTPASTSTSSALAASERTGSSAPSGSQSLSAVSSAPTSLSDPWDEQNRSAGLALHAYRVGLQSGHWSDVTLHVTSAAGHISFKVHKLFLVRSPMLFRILMSSPSSEIVLPVDDKSVTEEGLYICLSYLYCGPTQSMIETRNARSVLASAHLLELEEVAKLAVDICKSSLSPANVVELARFSGLDVDSVPSPNYGTFSTELRDATWTYLVDSLPREVSSASATGKANGAGEAGKLDEHVLLSIYAELSFPVFQSIMQHEALPLGNHQARFAFCKRCIALRRQRHGIDAGEEQVVLAFGSGSNIRVVRKPPRRLTKAGPLAS